ncbi:HD domain-containing phosphohydrolase [Conexibacter sp. DBS9H8]|uniref:HD domain-containing phosphohydrolase n=1 Tax=Conexibacter sp. DBS9H8 TaxID=2937801 RepID=UPI00200C2373|nr:HD domain-containing phosphohydrolase [Conexibacter sp. DBS9H8]
MPLSRCDLLDSYTDIVGATTVGDCKQRIETHARLLFGARQVTVRLCDGRDRAPGLVLVARERLVGTMQLAWPEGWEPDSETDAELLAAFTAHAAIALDNVRLLEEHHRRARSDPLTGLLNRGEFQETLARLLTSDPTGPEWPVGLIVMDLDRFKAINDGGGHAAGDRLLRATAAALTGVCRASDSVFRLGGDEFAVVLPGAGAADATVIAERAAAAIARLDGSSGVSWGVASVPDDAMTRDALVRIADANMYAHKGRPQTAARIHDRDGTERLEVACRLASRLTELRDPRAIAEAVVHELHAAFGYYLAVIHRLDEDGMLRILAGAGPLTEEDHNFLAWVQPVSCGVNGRVVRSAQSALVNDTRLDPDYLGTDASVNPGSELAVPILIDGTVWGVLNLEQLATHAFAEDDVLLAETVVAQAAAALHRCALLEDMEGSFGTTLALLCDALETKDPYTANHAQHVADIAEQTAVRMDLADPQRRALRFCALLHDIGKLGIRTELLTKPSALTPEEYEEVKQHSVIGAALLTRVPLLVDIAPLVGAVHERWDGRGYPHGLSGSQIPIESRIVAVCDAWHAMVSDRPYRRALSSEDALAELQRHAGSQFDPAVVRAFVTGKPAAAP